MESPGAGLFKDIRLLLLMSFDGFPAIKRHPKDLDFFLMLDPSAVAFEVVALSSGWKVSPKCDGVGVEYVG